LNERYVDCLSILTYVLLMTESDIYRATTIEQA